MSRALITGVAGFIGFHLARRLLADGWEVAGTDALTPYYDPALKTARLAELASSDRFRFHQCALEDMEGMRAASRGAAPQAIVHLAAQAGVRYSLTAPRAYVEANLVGGFNLLEIARELRPAHLIVASTSSIYGANGKMPFAEADKADLPLTLYAASKKALEGMSHAYAHLHAIPTSAVRFFTVYGPWGRPDMAPFKFVEAIRGGREIEVYNRGAMARDFTFIDDLIEGLTRLIAVPPRSGEAGASPVAPWRAVNIGAGAPTDLEAFIATLERRLGKRAKRRDLPMQQGDVGRTFADTRLLESLTGWRPTTPVEAGVDALCAWHERHYPNGAPVWRAPGEVFP